MQYILLECLNKLLDKYVLNELAEMLNVSSGKELLQDGYN